MLRNLLSELQIASLDRSNDSICEEYTTLKSRLSKDVQVIFNCYEGMKGVWAAAVSISMLNPGVKLLVRWVSIFLGLFLHCCTDLGHLTLFVL